MIDPTKIPKGWNWCVGVTETLLTASAWRDIEPYRDERGGIVYREVVSVGGDSIEDAFNNLVQELTRRL